MGDTSGLGEKSAHALERDVLLGRENPVCGSGAVGLDGARDRRTRGPGPSRIAWPGDLSRCARSDRLDFNTDRPHEALGNELPAAVYQPSPRAYPSQLPELEYPGHFALRRVRDDGTIRVLTHKLYLTASLAGEVIALQELDDRLWHIHFGPITLAVLDARERQFRLIPMGRD